MDGGNELGRVRVEGDDIGVMGRKFVSDKELGGGGVVEERELESVREGGEWV